MLEFCDSIFTPKAIAESYPALAGISDRLSLVSTAFYLAISCLLAVLCRARIKKKNGIGVVS